MKKQNDKKMIDLMVALDSQISFDGVEKAILLCTLFFSLGWIGAVWYLG